VVIPQRAELCSRVAEIVSASGVIAFRTDTFYGLGGDPFNQMAVRRIRALKDREAAKPILIVISDPDQMGRFIRERSKAFDLLAEGFWPGPLTLIGKARPEVPEEITAGTGTIGVRLPDDDDVRALARACGGALTATSANPSGQPPATTAREVEDYFPTGIDLIVDGGRARSNKPSSVFDVSGVEPRLVREGAIASAELQLTLSGGIPPEQV
jgi:L-threonylcarbamoyladenylate synthase